MPWAETAVLVGIWLALAAFVVPRMLIGPSAEALGAGRAYTDIGNAFEKAAEVARYADLRLVRAVAGNPLPEPPRIHGDVVAARVAWGYAIVATVLFGVIAVAVSRQSPARFVPLTGLNASTSTALIPGLAVAVVYPASGCTTARSMRSRSSRPSPAASKSPPATPRSRALRPRPWSPPPSRCFFTGRWCSAGSLGVRPAALVSSVLFAS
jgi:hypothetical protein